MYSARADTIAATTRAPHSQAQFCKLLVKAGQCLEGVDYEPNEEYREYYDKLVGEQLLCLPSVNALLVENMPALLDAVGDGDLKVESIAYTQLKPIRCVMDCEPPAADGTFQTFTAPAIRTSASKTKRSDFGVKVVMGPSGCLYEPLTKTQAKYTLVLHCTAGTASITCRIKCGSNTRRSFDVLFAQLHADPREVTYQLDFAHPLVAQFTDVLREARAPAPSPADDETMSVTSAQSYQDDLTGDFSSKFQFEENDGRLYVAAKKRKVEVANFTIKHVYARYVSQTAPPIYKVGCEVDGEEKVVMLEPSLYKTYTDVLCAFQMADVDLITIEMSPSMLTSYVHSIEDKPQRSKLIAFWGLQKDGIFVLANTAFDTATGLLLRIEQTEWAVWAKTFTTDKVLAIAEEAFPRMVLMPLHCKYIVGYRLINEICPRMFLNNYWPALAVLAGQVVGMYYPFLQKGEAGGGAGSPLIYIQGDHGNGKSSAAKMAAGLTGHVGALPSGQTTGPALMRMVTLYSGIQPQLEDPSFAEGTHSFTAQFPSIVRSLYDGSERNVCGKKDSPRSPIAITSNDPMPCAHDTALWSRIVYIRFAPLEGEPPDMHLYEDFNNACRLHSALIVEYFMLGRPGGKFDVCAINDFIAFLDQVTCKSRERNNAGWARIGYLMVLLNRVYQGTPEKTRSLLEWLTESCHYQSTRMLSSPTLFDKFLAIVVEFINHGHSLTYDSGRCVYFHCYRTTVLIGDMPVLALRLDWWAQFLKKERLLDTTANQLRDAAPNDSAMRDDVPFYDVQTGIWPPLVDGRPYSEDEIEQAALTRAKPCIVIGMAYVNKFITDRLHTRKAIDAVLVTSQRAGVGEYNFVEAICSGAWFGFDTLDTHPFAPFASALMDTVDPEIEREHEEQQLPVVDYCTSIEFMNKTFNTDACPDDLPPCLQDPYFLFKTDDEHPAKHACIRPRGGARTRAPPRTPGDNTLPTRPTTRTPTTAPAAPRRLNLTLDEAMSESDLDHLVETAGEFYSLDELLTIFESEAAAEAASASAS
jgi:hypothetical protein